MLDFIQINVRESKDKPPELYPDFVVGRSKDLMVQGRSFYAIWDEEKKLWSRDEYDVQRLVDQELRAEADRLYDETKIKHTVKSMRSFNSNAWTQFKKFLQQISDSSHPLDSKLVFADNEPKKSDYSSRKLPYAMSPGPVVAWDELLGTLYSPEERAKIEWAIGSILSGDSKKLQKFFVLYGPAGTGKSTILNILEQLFVGYTTTFDGKALGSNNAAFATEVFKSNPLVAIQHDGDLSKIEDNTRLNSIISHEEMTMNEKYKPSYTSRVDALLFIGSNQPVKISDAKSGIIRRLIDIHPTGVKIPVRHYTTLIGLVEFELGAIAHHCLTVYREMGKNYYNGYRPMEMMLQTDVFFNFIEDSYDIFRRQDYTTLKQAYKLYKEYCSENGIDRPLPQYKMREELRNYFADFKERGEVDGESVRSYYVGFTAEKFKVPVAEANTFSLVVDETNSLLDVALGEAPAQLSKEDGTPAKKWSSVTTTLKDIDTHELHYVKVPENRVVIDFDLKDINGTKALERNLEAASLWPATYAELSKSGNGVHLHYDFDGDLSAVGPEYADGIEVKVYRGDASLRRRLTRCNGIPVSKISSGLPVKPKKEKMLQQKTINSERGLRELIERNLKKEIHAGTKPSVDFIQKILDDAYESGMPYDVSDMKSRILAFANNSSNQATISLKVVQKMKFASEQEVEPVTEAEPPKESAIVFYDVEVYPNLFIICWKYQGDDHVVRMINPSAEDVEALFRMKLVGFYNRRYDNHIIYAAAMGKTPAELFELSNKMINGDNRSATYGAAYGLSYADIWDFSTKRVSLKKFEIDLGIHHMEMDLPWDEPVDEKDWLRVCEYCENDVRATEAVFNDRKQDFVARQILAELSGLTVNDTTQRHTAKIIFGGDKNPQDKFEYTDLSKMFPGYKYDPFAEGSKSSYKGEDPGEGGYVYAEPGAYKNVALLDVASMHPTSLVELNAFGTEYTRRFEDLLHARMAIKRADYEKARVLLDGRLSKFLVGAEDDPDAGKALAYSLKIAINIVYGLTSASFENLFKDNRNIDNIVAKRGALFMIDLKQAIQAQGYTVAHIKTDSVKIPNADEKIIDFVTEFGKGYGYEFEHEATYDRFCLVNEAVYIAREKHGDDEMWHAVGAQFQHPYVFKALFSGDELTFDDFCESRSVLQGAMYLDLELDEIQDKDYKKMRHLGKTGRFVPVLEGGGALYRVKDDKYYAVTGTSGHLWIEAELAKDRKDLQIDMTYFDKLKDDAIKQIEKFEEFYPFIS